MNKRFAKALLQLALEALNDEDEGQERASKAKEKAKSLPITDVDRQRALEILEKAGE